MQKVESHVLASEKLWHTLSTDRTLAFLDVQQKLGLSEEEAKKRLEQYGPNQLTAAHRTQWWELLLEQFKNVLVVILLIAVGLSAVLGHEIEAIAIAVIVLFAVLLGFIQEFRAERAIEALKKMAAPLCTVLRGGKEWEIDAANVVPGDIVLLTAGDKVPADIRVIESMSLHADEAALTGESVPVQKHVDAIENPKIPLGDRKNMAYAGTIITYGRGRGVMTATGMQTEFGKIAGMLQTVESEETPLQKNLDKLGHSLAKAALVIVLIIVGLGYSRGQPLLDMIIFGVALAVAVVPEALPAVVTISLAIGVQRMVKRHALVRKLPAVETLGSTSIICSDKTGTLTKDEMTTRQIYAAGETFHVSGSGYAPEGSFTLGKTHAEPSTALLELLTSAVLSSDATLLKTSEGWDIKGDPTEGALIVAAAKAGLEKEMLMEEQPRIAEIPFTSETKRMTTLHTSKEGEKAYAKGAPEVILSSCTKQRTKDGVTNISEHDRTAILAAAKAMADASLRVLGVSMKASANLGDAEEEMTFLGLVGMIDPPRPEAKEAVATCALAGIKVVMITGDHPATAQAIARELGILTDGRAVTGAELDAMSDEEFERSVEEIEVYARVSPAHKLKVITALQKKGHIVAMTGDGVNDAPALKKADIGIAMGITGTDVSKEAAAMTLTDDNFASIVAAVEEGRGIFGNIKKYLMYLLSSNIGEIGLMTAATLMGVPLPLTAVQILYVNLATDGLPALALAVDPPERDLMLRAPRNPRRSIFTRPVLALMLSGGIWSALVNIGLFLWAMNSGRSLMEAMTMTFVSLVLIQFFKAYNFRSDRNSILRRPFANKWLNIAVLWELVLLFLIIYVPFLQFPFETVALSLREWLIIGGLSITVIPVLESTKWLVRRGVFGSIV